MRLATTRLILLLWLVPGTSFGMDRLSALSLLETGNNDRAVGKMGEISRYQVLKSEWRTVTASRNYSDPDLARQVTLKLLDQRVERFKSLYNRTPTDFEFYALWNAPAQVLTGQVGRVVAERSRRFANLCGWTHGPVAALHRTPPTTDRASL
jgi:hypothetical protein